VWRGGTVSAAGERGRQDEGAERDGADRSVHARAASLLGGVGSRAGNGAWSLAGPTLMIQPGSTDRQGRGSGRRGERPADGARGSGVAHGPGALADAPQGVLDIVVVAVLAQAAVHEGEERLEVAR